jgi:LacI family transcriptional regulator
VVSALDDLVTRVALEALTRELADGGVALILSIAGVGVAASEECVQRLVAREADPIVFCGGTTPIEPGSVYPGRGTRLACLDEAATSAAMSWSGFDRAKALALGARYLHQLGHVRIGLFAIGERFADMVRRTLAGTGMDIADGIPANDSKAGVSDALDHWWGLPAPPTALVCGSDVAAVAVLRECKRREIAVPAQWSVIGFGGSLPGGDLFAVILFTRTLKSICSSNLG